MKEKANGEIIKSKELARKKFRKGKGDKGHRGGREG